MWTDTLIWGWTEHRRVSRTTLGGEGGCSASTGLLLAASVSTGGGRGSLVMRGRGGRRGLGEFLTAIMHGVAGDDHGGGHGNGGAPHGELVGDRVVRTAAAGTGLACGGSLNNTCAHDGAHPGVGVVYNAGVHIRCREVRRSAVRTQGDEVVVRH